MPAAGPTFADQPAGGMSRRLWDTTVSVPYNRQRVYASAVGGNTYRLSFYGKDVQSDSEGCGTNSTRVWYARLHEDNARDDGGDLTTYIRPEP